MDSLPSFEGGHQIVGEATIGWVKDMVFVGAKLDWHGNGEGAMHHRLAQADKS